MPVPQKVHFLVGWAGEPAQRRVIDNGARDQLKPTTECDENAISCSPLLEDFRCETGVFHPCRTGNQTRDSIANMNTPQPSLTKTELRKSLLNTRKSLSAQEWKQKSDRLCNRLQNSPLFTQAKTILAYFSCRQEPDLSPLFTSSVEKASCLLNSGDRQDACPTNAIPTPKKWGFPRCVGKELSWHIWQPGDALQTGAYGILEPLPDAPKIYHSEVDLMLVPAVGCDVRGYRLGYGGGYYDRMFSLAEWESKIAIGIIFEFALVAQLPVDSWDLPLHGICTESGCKIAQRKS